ncbi:DUF4179 domain-containing protein [Lysinibacillus sp. 54212]|uniref:DUF4179 domain-containing protein n=1 Tax=Lysinibacillus sp. 54212 TaxID=3119829 RepID=UPI002FC71F3D
MRNDLFDEIEVPKADVQHAIKQGIAKGKKVQQLHRKKTMGKRISIFGSVAAAAVLASGLIIAPIGNALAQVPFIGDYYQKLQMPIGEEMASEQLITEINESVTNNGVTMTITSAFYDGHFLGITFKATGENLTGQIGGDNAPESGYTFDLFTQGDDTDGFGGSMAPLVKEGDAYIGAIIFDNDRVKDLTTLPITFTYITGVFGEWQFNVPVEALPSKTLSLQQTSTSKDQAYAVRLTDAVINKASIIVNFEIDKQAGIEGEHLLFRTKVKTKNGYAYLKSQSDNSIILEKGIDTETIILEPYFKIGKKEIDLTPIEFQVK